MTEKMAEFHHSVEKGHAWKEAGLTTQGRRGVKVGTLLLGNDKNKVIVDKVLSYFYCLSHIFEVYVAVFGLNNNYQFSA